MGNTEYILQALLDQTKDSNTVLNSIRDSLVEQARGNGSSGNGNRRQRNDNNRNDDNRQGSFFKSLSGTIKNELGAIGKFGLGNAGGSPVAVANQLGTTVSNVSGALSRIPGPVGAAAGAFQLIVDTGMMLYNYMNDQLDLYNRISSAGVNLEKGTLSLRRGSQLAMLSVDEFNTVLLDNTVAVAKLNEKYGNGVERLGSFVQEIAEAQNQVGLYGLSQKQITDLTLKQIKVQNLLGASAQLRDIDQVARTKEFIGVITNLSKAVGESVDKLMSTAQAMSGTASAILTPFALMDNLKINPKDAETSANALVTFFSSIPDGQYFIDGFQRYLTFGSSITEGQSAAIGVYGKFQNDVKRIAQMGGDVEAKNKELFKMIASYQNPRTLAEIRKEMQIAQKAGPDQAESLRALTSLYNMIVNTTIPEVDTKPQDAMSELANRFNIWVNGQITTPLSDWMTSMQDGFATWSLAVLDSKDSSELFGNLANGFVRFNRQFNGTFKMVLDSYEKVTDPENYKSITELWDKSVDTVKGWYKTASDYFFGRSYEINDDGTLSPKALFGDDVARLFTSLKDKVSSWVTDFTDWIGLTEPEKPKEPIIPFNELPQEDIRRMMGSYKTQLQGHELEEYRQMNDQYRNEQLNRDAASTKPKPLQVNTNSSTKPEKTPVQKIEIPKKETINTDAIDNTMKMQQEQRDIDNLNLTKNMLTTMQSQADQYQIMMNYLREIAENTIPEAST